jgi:Kdo2-lipid IVA lauroyltransferase/acyltransferase
MRLMSAANFARAAASRGLCCAVVLAGSFEIEIKELRVPRTKNQSEDVRWIMTEMQRQFEAWVREAPEQWMWSNRRWN